MRQGPRVQDGAAAAGSGSELRAKMAARWGAGEETLSIGGMELFTAGGSLQRHDLEEDETRVDLSDLALSSLDAGELLGTFQGYIDNSLISIIDEPGASAEHKDPFDEENELSLLTALTEILDNADDENMSPFDTIPDTELLVSPKDRDGSMKFLCLSRTPPDHEMFSVDGQRRANCNKIDGRCPGPNWELFPDTISSTPKRRNRHKSVRGYLPRRVETEETQQRSDGEDEEFLRPGDIAVNSSLLGFDKKKSVDTAADGNGGNREKNLMQRTPCIINTENVALNEFIKYMHPYCLPAITVCLESEGDDKNLLKDAVFLEIVSNQGECIKVPVVVEPPADLLSSESSDGVDVESESLPSHSSSSEGAPVLAINEKQVDYTEQSDVVHHEPMDENYGAVPWLQELSAQPPAVDLIVKPSDDGACNSGEIVPDTKKNEPAIAVSIAKEKMPLKGKRTGKDKQPSKSKLKSKTKSITEDMAEPIPVQSVAQPPVSRPSNPSLQESDFLTKTLDQVKKESQMELRFSKNSRTKARARLSLGGSNPERKMADRKVKPVAKVNEQTKGTIEVAVVDKDLEQSLKFENPKSEETQDFAAKVEDLTSDGQDVKDVLIASDSCSGGEDTGNRESGASKVEDMQEDGDSLHLAKEAKPKLLSLSEYRKRLQHRKPNRDQSNENQSCSKWPTVPEPPTELAELPCLILPAQSNKPAEVKACPPNKARNVPGPSVPVSPASVPNTVTAMPVTSQDVQQVNEKQCPTVMDVAPHPMITPQPTMPPPFYPPAWPTVPPHPAFYPTMPPLPAVPHYPNSMPLQPPPVMSWPPYPPPPIAVPPVPPTGWVSGLLTPYWPNVQMAQGMPERQSRHNSPEKSVITSPHALLDQKTIPETIVPPLESRPQTAVLPIVQTNWVPKPENYEVQKKAKTTAKPDSIDHDSSSTPEGSQIRPVLTSSLAATKSQPAPPSTSKNANVPDLKSANQVVFKIMEILKKAQKLGFQIKPSSNSDIGNTQLGIQVSPSAAVLQAVQAVDKTPAPVTEGSAMLEKVSVTGSVIAHNMAEDDLASSCIGTKQEAKEPVILPRAETLCTSEESFHTIAETDPKVLEQSFTCDSGIEASDLTSLLEQFEKSEAKEEERLPQSPDNLAVGNSGAGKTLEKKIHDKLLAPELVNTAGLTPPATPPHQLWKSAVTGPLTGKSKSLHGQEKTCSPLKTAKLIEPKPLPQSLLKNRNFGLSSVALPPIHVASGDHDYCILSNQRTENKATTAAASPTAPSQCEEGSRWNVKHHQNITIKPIVQFSKPGQSKSCPKQSARSAPSVTNQSIACGPVKPVAPCDGIQKAIRDPLDHRTNVMAECAVASPPGSVLMSPDSSPCRSINGEHRTDLKRESGSASRRALRCYRKYKGSPSPPKSWRGRSSGSRSDSRSSSSSSSSRSRSSSPASKRRRTSRYRSRSRRKSRSSSGSSYGTSSSSRSSSCSSRSCSLSSRSRSRSGSPYRRRYRSRSRRCESRESYNRRRIYHKERAIEERRVVYVGKINNLMTRSELRRRFSIFGDIEECTIHFRDEGDNYGFVTYRCTREAFTAIENGHKVCLPDELPFDLCFGGRRQFCRSNYADLDSNHDDFDPAPVRSKFESLDFDTLLKQAQKSHRR